MGSAPSIQGTTGGAGRAVDHGGAIGSKGVGGHPKRQKLGVCSAPSTQGTGAEVAPSLDGTTGDADLAKKAAKRGGAVRADAAPSILDFHACQDRKFLESGPCRGLVVKALKCADDVKTVEKDPQLCNKAFQAMFGCMDDNKEY
ncbi:hypothetical protein TRIUR3_32102 [Triticum urartu]|uniref:Uncharacterized protein n=1 Tax=Triticum urartu TaxID=4572 RepID=M7ZS49_TRIUA|nr:hypothetical protein TRIUR3_32102 [Triticum urartu]